MHKKRMAPLTSVMVALAGTFLLAQNVSCSQHPGDTATVNDPAPPPASPASQPEAETPPPATAASAEGAGEETTDNEKPVASDADKANLLLAQAMTPPAPAANSRWKQGRHYALIKPAQPTAAGPDKIEVLEMFWYGCPHCYSLEPFLQNWETKKSPYIQFTRIPATWGIAHQLHARLYYTLLELNRADLHMTAFREAQLSGTYLLGEDVQKTERVQTDFAKRHGIDPAAFKKAYHSEAVTKNIEKADELLRRYKVDSVPHVIINGKYWADVTSAGGPSQLISLINDLSAREQDTRQ